MLSRLLSRITKIGRDRQPRVDGQTPHVGPPFMGNPVPLPPGIYLFPVERPTDHFRYCCGHVGPPAEILDQLRMGHDPYFGHSVRFVKPDFHHDPFAGSGDNPRVNEAHDPYKVDCGRRLVAARKALGYDKRRSFARLTLESETEDDLLRSEDRLKSWEIGRTTIPPWYVAKLRQLFAISADWIYIGDMSAMPHELAQKIIRQEQD